MCESRPDAHATFLLLLACACGCVCIRSPLPRLICFCNRTAQTSGTFAHMHAVAGCHEVGLSPQGESGGFPARKSAALNHMRVQGGSFGSRPGLEGNQQHMSRILGSGVGDIGPVTRGDV